MLVLLSLVILFLWVCVEKKSTDSAFKHKDIHTILFVVAKKKQN